MPSDKDERDEPRDDRTKPGETHCAKEKRQWIREKFAGGLQQMIQPRSRKTREARKPDDDVWIGGHPPAEQVAAHDEKGHQQSDGDEYAVRTKLERADVNEWIHFVRKYIVEPRAALTATESRIRVGWNRGCPEKTGPRSTSSRARILGGNPFTAAAATVTGLL